MDSLIKLWELSTSRCLIAYTGAGTTGKSCNHNANYVIYYFGVVILTGKQEHRAQASFNHTEDFVMFPDEATTSLCVWNSRNASRKQLLSLGIDPNFRCCWRLTFYYFVGHNGAVRYICHSPNSPAFLTCSDDFRARFWYRRMAH